ncbi:MAG: Tim44/TimA family putative adaptor protein [Maricaulaceae bacterium]
MLFAVSAAGILQGLNPSLGRRPGHDPEAAPRPAPEARTTPPGRPELRSAFTGPAAAGMEAIRARDGAFEPEPFLEGARAAYEMIVENFAKGDRDALKGLLSEAVFRRYDADIAQREDSGQTRSIDVVRIAKSEIQEAEIDGDNAKVRVLFAVDLTGVTQDAEGRVIEGDPNRITRTEEVWTFERDLTRSDPNWRLCGVSAVG